LALCVVLSVLFLLLAPHIFHGDSAERPALSPIARRDAQPSGTLLVCGAVVKGTEPCVPAKARRISAAISTRRDGGDRRKQLHEQRLELLPLTRRQH
jgi:hypothetical protein